MGGLRGIWIGLKSSLWFLPSLCVLFSTGLALGLVEVDSRLKLGLSQYWPQFFGLSAAGSRSILATIAQSVITIAGVTFSITIVALSVAANQYTPRVLRNFMRDRGNQSVLGGLVGIFTYCIIVLRTIHGGERSFIPAVSVMMALALAMVAISLFIYFIHHVATTIQASSIICSIAQETKDSILKQFPEQVGPHSQDRDLSEEERRSLAEDRWQSIAAHKSGYLQSMDSDQLALFAQAHGTILVMEHEVGEFVIQGKPLVRFESDRKLDDRSARRLRRLFNIQSYRTIDQDPAFGIRQIVDIAVKALSPGINDPTTATTCLNYLASILCMVAQRHIPPRCRYEDGKLCVIDRRPSFQALLELAFNEIRQNSGSQPSVLISLLATIEEISTVHHLIPERGVLLAKHAQLVLGMAEQNISFGPDLESIRKKAEGCLRSLETNGPQ